MSIDQWKQANKLFQEACALRDAASLCDSSQARELLRDTATDKEHRGWDLWHGREK